MSEEIKVDKLETIKTLVNETENITKISASTMIEEETKVDKLNTISTSLTAEVAIDEIVDTIIIGGGPAAYSAGLNICRTLRPHILFEGHSFGGQLLTTSNVENYPGIKKINGFDLVNEMREQAIEQGCKIISELVTSLELRPLLSKAEPKDRQEEKVELKEVKDENNDNNGDHVFQVVTIDSDSQSNIYLAKTIILATGSEAKRLWSPSEEKYWGQGISSCAVCDGSLKRFRNQKIIVIGGGDSAFEEADYLSAHGSKIIIIHRGPTFSRAAPVMIERAKKAKNIEFLMNHTVKEFLGVTSEHGADDIAEGEGEGGLRSVIVQNVVTKEITTLENVRGVFYGIGHSPAVDLILKSETLKDKVKLDSNNYVIVGQHVNKTGGQPGYKSMTSVKGLFAAGDVMDPIFRQVAVAVGNGTIAGMNVHKYLSTL